MVGQIAVGGMLPCREAGVRARRVDDQRPLAGHRVAHLERNLGRGELRLRDLREVRQGDREPSGTCQFAPARLGGVEELLSLEAAEHEAAAGVGEVFVLDRV